MYFFFWVLVVFSRLPARMEQNFSTTLCVCGSHTHTKQCLKKQPHTKKDPHIIMKYSTEWNSNNTYIFRSCRCPTFIFLICVNICISRENDVMINWLPFIMARRGYLVIFFSLSWSTAAIGARTYFSRNNDYRSPRTWQFLALWPLFPKTNVWVQFCKDLHPAFFK